MELSKEERKRLKREQKALKLEATEEVTQEVEITNPDKLTVICVRFGNRYGIDYVERLRNMVSRNLSVPYEFVCLTDDQHVISGVRNIYQPNARYSKGWWHKVHMFDPTLPISGRILYFDLDVVIHNNIDKLATVWTEDFLGIKDFNRQFYQQWSYLNSSVMCWNHGTQNHIWNDFKKSPSDAQKLQGDQDWIWKTSKDRIKFWPKEWIMSYKWEVRKKEDLVLENGKRRFKQVKDNVTVHPDCCVTVFHGDPKPQDVQDKFVVDNWR
jgi:hypothetical protein